MELKEYVKLDMQALVKNSSKSELPHMLDKKADTYLVGYIHRAMTEKLEVSRNKGRGGWWNPNECSIDTLKRLLMEHIDKGDMIDVINIAAMIYARECAES